MEISELSKRVEKLSARYGEHLGIERNGNWLGLKLQEEIGELTQAYLQVTGRARTKGKTPDEIRDGFHARHRLRASAVQRDDSLGINAGAS